jgi:hypothetical protein
MTAPRRTSDQDHIHVPRTLLSRILRYWLDPVYYYLDLLDNQRRPSHSKVTWTVVFIIAMILWVFLTTILVRHAIRHNLPLSGKELAFLLAYAVAMISTAGGLDGWKSYLKSKGGGTVEAFQAAVSEEGRERPSEL